MRPKETLIRLLARRTGGAVVACWLATSAMASDDYERPEPDDSRFPAKIEAYGVLIDSGFTVKMQSQQWFPKPGRCSIRVGVEADYTDKLA